MTLFKRRVGDAYDRAWLAPPFQGAPGNKLLILGLRYAARVVRFIGLQPGARGSAPGLH